MPERFAELGRRGVAAVSVLSLLLAGPASSQATAAPASAAVNQLAPLAGWLGNGAEFPRRALVLSVAPTVKLTAAALHVSENRTPVSSLTVTPTARAGKDDFGVMLVVDQSSSMAGPPLTAALTAARAFAARRTGAQQLGAVTFDSSPVVYVPLSSDEQKIAAALNRTPVTGDGADLPGAMSLALGQLASSKVALGAIVVISDGVGDLSGSGGATPASVQAQAAAAHVPIFTVGLQDASSTPASMSALRAASGGQFVQSTPAGLPAVTQKISTALTRGYVVRYRSSRRAGERVTVTAAATGVPGTVLAGYRSPARIAPVISTAPVPRVPPAPARPLRHPVPRSSHTLAISPVPSYGAAVPPPGSVQPATSFWRSPQSVPILAGICGLLFALSLFFVLYRPTRRAARARVGSFIPGALNGEEGLKQGGHSRGVAPRIYERGSWWAPFVEDVAVARGANSPADLVMRAAVAGVVLAVLVTVVSGTPLFGLAPLLGWPWALRKVIARAARKQRELFADTLPGYLQDISSAMRVGRSFAGALAVIAASADEPVRGELERAVTDEQLGRSLEESLEKVARRMQDADVDQVALIAALNRRSGSNVAEAVDRVAEGARDRLDSRREVRALTAQAKMSSWVLTALPPMLLLGISFVSPQYAHPLFHSTAGIALLVVGAGMVFAGWKVMAKITTIRV